MQNQSDAAQNPFDVAQSLSDAEKNAMKKQSWTLPSHETKNLKPKEKIIYSISVRAGRFVDKILNWMGCSTCSSEIKCIEDIREQNPKLPDLTTVKTKIPDRIYDDAINGIRQKKKFKITQLF